MNFTFTWIMDRLGYMPKIDMQVGKVEAPDLSKPAVKKRKPALKKATTVAKKAK
jgi:hypothetical protein